MVDNPPAAEERLILRALARRGVQPGRSFDIAAIDLAVAQGLERAVNEQLWPEVLKFPTVNGWIQPANTGRCGIDHDTRMGIAFVGLGANMQAETIYPTTFYDGAGDPLCGDRRYALRFERRQQPPTNATWSVSQRVGNFYVQSELARYANRPSMPLTYGDDESLEIYFQAHSPDGEKAANWLPVSAAHDYSLYHRDG